MVDNRCTPISNNIIFGHKRIEGKSKFIKATEKKSEEIIKSKCAWFRKLSENVDGNIVIMGLSCSDADKPYLLEIRNALPNNNWVFYYHDNADKENKEKCAIELGLTMDKYQLLPDDLGK